VVDFSASFIHIIHLIHDYSALLLAFLLVFHILLAAVVPWAWPMFLSMITGNVKIQEVQKHHKKWYKELQEKGLCPKGEAHE
jgi:cytochrome b subunit of formate dehydrogenase